MESGSKLLSVLLRASEKAANIARVCRENKALFDLLVQEKTETEKNPSFIKDFKTLADVLIQETIKHDIGLEFPELAKVVQGEENNSFTNTLGESIIVEVCSTCEETTSLLAKVMGGKVETAGYLAVEVHKNVELTDVPTVCDIPNDFIIPIEDLGIWIDPIDATGEYICPTVNDTKGLRCVTVLIGVYLKSTGLPIVGVVNKPFCELNIDQEWTGICYWGYLESDIGRCCIRIANDSKCSIDCTDDPDKIILIGRSENAELKSKLTKAGFTLTEVAGAGHKILSVALGTAAAYVLSKSSTYKWDTCAPQAILRSLGGGIVDFHKFLENPDSDDLDLTYSTADYCDVANNGGLIAYRNPEVLQMLKHVLC